MKIPDHYSLIHEKDDHFMVHDAKDNKAFPIAKKNVHPATQMKIMKLKKFAEGGNVEGDDLDAATEAAPAPQPTNDLGSVLVPQVAQPQAPPGWSAPMLPPQVPAQPQGQGASGDWGQSSTEMPQTPQDVAPHRGDILQQFQENQGLEEQGLKNKANAELMQGQEMANIHKTATEHLQNFLNTSNQEAQNMNIRNEQLAQEVASERIDPNRYVNNLGTGKKISNAIAMIVGGIGAGLTHGPNLAVQTIQKAIDEDIQSQRENLGKKQSLLSMNLQRYKDMRAAETATMMQMNAITQGQLAATSAKYGGAIGQSGTQALLGQLKNKNLQDSMGLKQALFTQQLQEHLQNGDVSGQNPLDYVRHVVPPDKQKEVATELGKAQFATENHDRLMKLWDQAQKEQTIARTGFGVVDAPATKALRALGDPLIHDNEGRVNEFEKKDFEGLLPSSGQLDSRQKELRPQFEAFINGKKSAPLAKANGIDINRFNSTRTQNSDTMERIVTRGPDKGKTAIFDSNKKFLGYK